MMYCQKCRSPLKVDSSLETLSPAALDLLTRSAGKAFQQSSTTTYGHPPSASYPQERKELYDRVSSKNASSTTTTKRAASSLSGQRRDGSRMESPASELGTTKTSRDNPAMSFVMLTESQVVPPASAETGYNHRRPSAKGKQQQQDVSGGGGGSPGIEGKKTLSNQLETTTRLFEMLSARSDIDHPVCVECTELLVDGLTKRLENVTKERDGFVGFLRTVNAENPTDEERRRAEEELKAMRREEEAAYAELQQLERDKAEVDAEIGALEDEARQLDLEEEKFWRERNAFALRLAEFQNQRDSVNLQYDHDSKQLERLQRTNVYNDTFCIGHDGYFGTINGLRLGRLPSQPVEWAEINAAWGQTLLLLATVADRLGFCFEGYKLRPMGSTSKIEKYEVNNATTTTTTTQGPSGSQPSSAGPSSTAAAAATAKVSVLELYSSGDLPLGRMFLHRKFDNAMVAFLDCLRQVGDFVQRQTRAAAVAGGNNLNNTNAKMVELPYEIKKDKIGDACIKLGFNQDESWTRACKYTLTCCKFVLAHASNLGSASAAAAGAAGPTTEIGVAAAGGAAGGGGGGGGGMS